VFAESGLLVGFFLPGDSLIFTAGFLASQGLFEIGPLAAMLFIAAVSGDSFGYWCGKRFGPSIFSRRGSLLLDRSHVDRAEAFYARHGGKTIVLARFVPIVRTFAPILAGVGSMRYRTFLAYNLIGGAVWALGLSWMGYFLGARIPHIDRYLLPIVALIVIASIAPSAIHLLRTAEGRARARATARAVWNRRSGGAPAEDPAVAPPPAEKDSALR
jgi:membrane-associated protein